MQLGSASFRKTFLSTRLDLPHHRGVDLGAVDVHPCRRCPRHRILERIKIRPLMTWSLISTVGSRLDENLHTWNLINLRIFTYDSISPLGIPELLPSNQGIKKSFCL